MRRQSMLASTVMCALAVAGSQLVSPGPTLPIAEAHAPYAPAASTGSADCVEYDQHLRENGLDVTLISRCKTERSCTVKWRLRCQGDKHSSPGGAAFTLPAAGRHTVDASAATCGDAGWQVRNVRWRCKGVK